MMAPRVRVQQVWRIPPEHLEQAQDDATIVAIRDQERAGIDIITDGEIRRESYSNKFANALDGIDRQRHGEIVGRTGNKIPVPIVSGPIKRRAPVEVRDVEFLRAHTDRTIKITLPGPFTMAQQAVERALSRRAEPRARLRGRGQRGGARSVRGRRRHRAARRAVAAGACASPRAVTASRRSTARLAGVRGTTALHLCFGYAALVKDKPSSGYSFLAELEESAAGRSRSRRRSRKLDLSILKALPTKTVMVGVLDFHDRAVETAGAGRVANSCRARVRAARSG